VKINKIILFIRTKSTINTEADYPADGVLVELGGVSSEIEGVR
jgi:hypothetical protein